jgi:organic hydroperoxide reductase OsmC/OhrA
MSRTHRYTLTTVWTGNTGQGTATYNAYERAHELSGPGKPAPIPGSSDPHFRGDGTRYNPEELFVGSLSACHMLWYLHLCADAGVVVTAYSDPATGTLVETPEGGGAFQEVVLRPHVAITEPGRLEDARALHARAHALCFLARSVRCEVRVEPTVHAEAR